MNSELQFAFRMASKNPGTTLAIFLALALGIGSSTSIFSIVNFVMLRPLPVKDGERLVRIVGADAQSQQDEISMADYLDWKRAAKSFSQTAIFRTHQMTLGGNFIPERVVTVEMEWTMLPLLGVSPALGHNFGPASNLDGGSHEAFLGWAFWQSHFGGRAALGKRIRLDGESFTIIGILPKNFALLGRRDVFVPIAFDLSRAENKRGIHNYEVFARLAPGVSIAAANSELQSLTAASARAFPEENKGVSAHAIRLRSSLSGEGIGGRQKYLRPALLVLLAAVICVLLIACANVAHVYLVRGWARRSEMAIRIALGASWSRLGSQLLMESLTVSIAGAFAGLLLASILVAGFRRLPVNAIPRLEDLSLDWRVVVFALGLGVAAGTVFGIAPALRAFDLDLHSVLKQASRRATASQGQIFIRKLFIGMQTGAAVALLIECGLLVSSFVKVSGIDPGFATDHLLTFYLSLPPARYNPADYVAATPALRAILKRIQETPGVGAAAMTSDLPLSGTPAGGGVLIEGEAIAKQAWRAPYVFSSEVSPEYFRTMHIPLLAGRAFTQHDAFQRVVLVNRSFARQFFAKQNAVGRHVAMASANTRWQEIVGVVADVPQVNLEDPVKPELFYPMTVPTVPWVGVVARVAGDPERYIKPLRDHIAQADGGVAVFLPRTVPQILTKQFFWRKLQAWLVGTFACLAIVLASIGIYAVIAYSVSQRVNEIGLRIAVGASAKQVWWSVLWQGMQPAAIGAGAGLFVGFVAAKFTAFLFFQTSALNAPTYVGAAVLILLVAATASFLPAWRAARIDPARALRHE